MKMLRAVTQDDVQAARDSLIAQGKAPTVSNIVRITGGSNMHVALLLKTLACCDGRPGTAGGSDSQPSA